MLGARTAGISICAAIALASATPCAPVPVAAGRATAETTMLVLENDIVMYLLDAGDADLFWRLAAAAERQFQHFSGRLRVEGLINRQLVDDDRLSDPHYEKLPR